MEDPARSADDHLTFAEAESLYRTLVEELPAIVYIDSHDPEPHSLYVSPQTTDILGFLPEEWVVDRSLWRTTVHPVDRDRVMEDWHRAIRDRTAFRCEYRFVRRDGAVIWVSDEARLIVDPDGEPRYWQGVITDITDRRRAEETARNSEARYQALVEGIPAIVYEMGPDDERRTLYVSRHVEEILGYSREEWLDQPDIWMELLHPDDREVQLAAHDLHNETGEPWSREYRLIANDGREVWVRDVASLVRDADGRPRTWQGVMLDISAQKVAEEGLRLANDELEFRVLRRTAQIGEANEMMSLEIGERIRMEEELRETQERYRMLVERLPAVVYIWDAAPKEGVAENYTSPVIEQLVGFTVDEWLSHPDFWTERIHPHDRRRVMASAMASRQTGEPFREEYRLLAKDGHVVWVHDQSTLLSRGRDGRPKLFQGFLLDITDRKSAEAKAHDAEERYRFLAEEGPVIAYTVRLSHEPEPATEVEYLSPQIQEVLGYDLEAWRHDLWERIVHPDDIDWVREAFRATWEDDRPWVAEYRMIAADGRVVWFHAQGRAIEHDEQGRPTLYRGVLLEATDRKEAELALRTSESQYRSFVEEMPGVPWSEIVDPVSGAARMNYIGPQVERFFGWTAEELLAEPGHFERMLHPDDRDRVMAYTREVERQGLPEWRVRYRVIARDGRVMTLESHATAVYDEHGLIRAWHGFAVDVGRVLDAVDPDPTDATDAPVDRPTAVPLDDEAPGYPPR